MSSEKLLIPLTIKGVNIGSSDNSKVANIDDYQDDENIGNITNLLHEFQDLFLVMFSEIKEIVGDLGEMKIPFNPYAKLVKQRPYRMNLRYKEKVKEELKGMLDAGIIKPIKELEWISHMVVQDKKTGKVCICVGLRKLNDVYLHYPFPTSFTDEVIESVGGYEIYSFTNGFSGYHQIRIAKKYQHKTTFEIEWRCSQYILMSFDLSNSHVIFFGIVVVAFKEFIHKFLKVYFYEWKVNGLIKNHIEILILML